MGKVLFGLSVSLDGFIADKNDDVSEVFAWMGSSVVVLQSQAREPVKKGQTQFFFVADGIVSAFAQAKKLAGEKNVALHGASSVQQALKAGLLDELYMSIAHVLLGEGVRLFDHFGATPIHLERIRTLETPGATHLTFRVMK